MALVTTRAQRFDASLHFFDGRPRLGRPIPAGPRRSAIQSSLSMTSGTPLLSSREERFRSWGFLCALDQEPQHERHLTRESGEGKVADRFLVRR
jgi:hypothetical protein